MHGQPSSVAASQCPIRHLHLRRSVGQWDCAVFQADGKDPYYGEKLTSSVRCFASALPTVAVLPAAHFICATMGQQIVAKLDGGCTVSPVYGRYTGSSIYSEDMYCLARI